MVNNMDYESLREDLKNYFGTAIAFNQMAIIDLMMVESASNDKLVYIAIQNGFDLDNYKNQKYR